jgi:hypothetical protein
MLDVPEGESAGKTEEMRIDNLIPLIHAGSLYKYSKQKEH